MNHRQKRLGRRCLALLLVIGIVLFKVTGLTGIEELSATVHAGTIETEAAQTSEIEQAMKQGLDTDPQLIKMQQDNMYAGDMEADEDTDVMVGSTMPVIKSPFTRSTYRHAARFSGYRVAHGIDVSQWQGNINWSKVKKSGVEYVIIRVGYRGAGTGALRADSRYLSYIKGALKAKLKVGVYIYSQATTPGEARAEANFVLKRIKGYDISMPVVLDYEFYTSTSGRLFKAHLSKRQATNVCEAFCQTVENAGYTSMVYGNGDMLNNHLYAEELAKTRLMWLANFGKNNGKDRGFATAYNGTYSFWQYTSRGRVPGIGGNVDCNFWYKTSEITTKKVATGLSVTSDSITLKSGNMAYLYHSLSPQGAVDDIIWTSSRPSVAYVKDGNVYGVSSGETVITAATASGLSDSCKVVVSENLNNYEIQCPDSLDYTGRELKPAVTVISKKKQADSGTMKKNGELFSGPESSYSLLKTLKKGTSLKIEGSKGKYYAVCVTAGGKTSYGYVPADTVRVTKAKKTLLIDRDYTVKYSDNENVGTALVEVSGGSQGTFSGTISKMLTIKPVDVSKVSVDQISDQTAVGTLVTPKLSLHYQGRELVQDVDYSVTYTNNLANAGQFLGTSGAVSAMATVTGLRNYTGSVAVSYMIGDSPLLAVETPAPQSYTGQPVTPKLVVRAQTGTELIENQDYTVQYFDNVSIGNARAAITLMGAYSGSYQVYFPIVQRNIADASVTVLGSYTYNQKEPKAKAAVTYQGETLVEGTDYKVEYEHNSCAGQATLRVVGQGIYQGSKEAFFTIAPADISKLKAASIGTQPYGARALTPQVQLKDGQTSLLKGVDYSVSYQKNTNLGMAKVTVTGTGNYRGSRQLSFKIGKKAIRDCKISSVKNYKYKNKRIKPSVTIRNGGKKLKKGRDYTVSYGKNRKVGKGTIKIKGKGKYTGSKTIHFRIVH